MEGALTNCRSFQLGIEFGFEDSLLRENFEFSETYCRVQIGLLL